MEDRSAEACAAWMERANRFRLRLAQARNAEEVRHLEEQIDQCEIRAIKCFIASENDEMIPDPDIDQADGGVYDTPAPNPDSAHPDPRYVPGQDHGSDAPDNDQLKV